MSISDVEAYQSKDKTDYYYKSYVNFDGLPL